MTNQHKKKRKTVRRSIALLLTAFVVLVSGAAGTVQTSAETQNLSTFGITVETHGSITLKIPADRPEWYIRGAQFNLYRVADLVNDNGKLAFEFTTDFKESGVAEKNIQAQDWSVDGTGRATNSDWMDTAKALSEYAQKNEIEPDDSKKMNSRTAGVTFSDLEVGLYLIQGVTIKEGNRTVTYQPILICIPQRYTAKDDWKYEIEAELKLADPTYENVPSNGPTTTPSGTVTPAPSGTVTPTPSGSVTPSGTVTPTPSESVTPSGTITPLPSGTNTTPTPSGWTPSATTPGNPPTTPPSGTSPSGPSKLLNVATGDTTSFFVYLGIMITAAAVVCLVFAVRKKHED